MSQGRGPETTTRTRTEGDATGGERDTELGRESWLEVLGPLSLSGPSRGLRD